MCRVISFRPFEDTDTYLARDHGKCKETLYPDDFLYIYIQSTLVISNSKGLSEILRDIHTSIYQVCRIKEK